MTRTELRVVPRLEAGSSAPSSSLRLRRERRQQRLAERTAAGSAWQTHTFNGSPVELGFTPAIGGIVSRQAVATILKARRVPRRP